MVLKLKTIACLLFVSVLMTDCGSEDGALVGARTYTIGGTITGLSGTLVLRNGDVEDLSLTDVNSFTFTTAVADAGTYAVTVLTQPDAQFCSVSSGGGGTVSGANVTDVAVTCINTYTVGGTITGLSSGTLVLQNNDGNDLSLTAADDSFTFTTAVADGEDYVVDVLTQPDLQTCTVSDGNGTISGADVTNVTLTCFITVPSFSISVPNDGVGCDDNESNFENITITEQTATTLTATTTSNFYGDTTSWSGTKSGDGLTYTLTSASMASNTGSAPGLDCNYTEIITITGAVSPFSCTQITEALTRVSGDCEGEIDPEMTAPSGSCTDIHSSPTCTGL